MLNYFVDSHMWCFFLTTLEKYRVNVSVNRNKGREQRKESNCISWNLTGFYQQNKMAAVCCQASKAMFALLALPFVF